MGLNWESFDSVRANFGLLVRLNRSFLSASFGHYLLGLKGTRLILNARQNVKRGKMGVALVRVQLISLWKVGLTIETMRT